jgi:hypothetical protein
MLLDQPVLEPEEIRHREAAVAGQRTTWVWTMTWSPSTKLRLISCRASGLSTLHMVEPGLEAGGAGLGRPLCWM